MNEHGDPYFSLNNFVVLIIPFKKKFIEGKTRYGQKRARSMLLDVDANYDLDSDDSRNFLSQCCS